VNNNNRNYIDIVLILALIVAGGFLFMQMRNLNSTQTELTDAQAEITQVADTAATYAEAGTALAESADADARAAADELNYANSTATEAAADSANALEQANVAGTTSAEYIIRVDAAGTDSANALDNANATASKDAADSADTLTSANGTATRAANVARTQAADAATEQAAAQAENETLSTNLSNAEATNSAALELQATGQAQRDNLEDEVAALSTTQAGLETLANAQMTAIANLNTQLNTAYEQRETQATAIAQAEATIAAQADIIDSAPSSTSNNNVAEATPQTETNAKSMVLFETDTIQIYLPPDYVAIDPAEGLDLAMAGLSNLGPEFEQAAAALEQNPEFYLLWAARSQLTSDGFVENIAVTHVDALVPISMESFTEFGLQGLPEAMVITEQEIIELNGQEVLRLRVDFDLGFVLVKEVMYVYIVGSDIYVIICATSDADYEAREELFEAIAATLAIRE
jgi:hypothetical protein